MEIKTQPEGGASPTRNRRRMILMLGGVGVFLGLMVAFNAFRKVMIQRALAASGEPPQTVTTIEARIDGWQPALTAVGTVRGIQGADLAFEVPGRLIAVAAKVGSEVKQGQLLLAMDDAAEAAQLRQLQVAAGLAEVTYGRAKAQLADATVSKAEFDQAEADLEVKRAAVQSQAAEVAKKRLVAPFPGRVGIVTVSKGAYLNPGTPVVTLQQLDSVYVDFSLPQKDSAQVKPGQAVTITMDGLPDRTFRGKVTGVNPKIDPGTRNLEVEALFGNPGRSLLPGMFVRVNLDHGARQNHVTLPQTAINYNPYGAIVFLAVGKSSPGSASRKELVARQVFVTTGATRGDQVAIVKGLQAGALVVSSGGLKLRNGTPLIVDNRVQPANDAEPAPQER